MSRRSELSGLCYNTGSSIYGEPTETSAVRIAEDLLADDDMMHTSLRVGDLGSGSGVTLALVGRALRRLGEDVELLMGWESCPVRSGVSRTLLPVVWPGAWEVHEVDLLAVTGLPEGLIYTLSFDLAFPAPLLDHIETLQRACPTLRRLWTTQPASYPVEHWRQVSRRPFKMRGSGYRSTGYIMEKLQ